VTSQEDLPLLAPAEDRERRTHAEGLKVVTAGCEHRGHGVIGGNLER